MAPGNRVIAILVVISIAFTYCASRDINDIPFYQPENSKDYSHEYELAEEKEVVLHLDTLIGFRNNSVCFTELNGKKYLSVLNAIGKSIYFFDYVSGNIVSKIPLSTDGPDGVGKIDNTNNMHFVKNLDSVYFINSWTSTIYCLNSAGKVLSKKELTYGALRNWVGISSETNFQIPVSGENIYFRMHPRHLDTTLLSDLPSVLQFNLRTGESKYVLNFPDTYNHVYWGGNPFKYLPSIGMTNDAKFIVSYPVDPFVYTYDSRFNLTNKNYVSSAFFKTIAPMEEDASMRLKKHKTDYIKEKNYAMTNSDYNFIGPDASNNFYLRMVYLRPDIDGYKNGKFPEMSWIIFDKNYKKVGETKLDDKTYWTTMIFSNSEGLHIPKKIVYEQDESKLTFGVFKVRKIPGTP